MSNYSFTEEDLERERSLNAYREEMRRQEQARYEEQLRKELGNPASDFIRESERQLTRTVRSAIQSDPIAQETRTAFIAAQTVVNVAAFVALSVGSIAAETAYARSVMSTQDSYKEMYKDAMDQRQQELSRDDRTLAAYQQRVEETRQQLAQNDPVYAREYRETTDAARDRIQQANETHRQASESIQSQQRQADTAYKNTTSSCHEKLQESQQQFNRQQETSLREMKSSVNDINSNFERERERIVREYPKGPERQQALAAASSQRDSQIERAQQIHAANVQTFQNEMSQRNAPIQRELNRAEQTHRSTINQLTERQQQVDSQRTSVVSRERDIIKTATDKYDKLSAEAKKEFKGAQAELAKYNDQIRGSAAASIGLSALNGHTNVNRGAERLVSAIRQSHKSLGMELAAHLGTDKERELIAKYKDDLQAAKTAKDNGERYKSTLTDSEKEQISQIAQKYAGNLSSEAGVDKAITALKKANQDLMLEKTQLDKSLTSLKTQMNGVNDSIRTQTAALKQLRADQELLKKGVDKDGKKLTPEERKKIQERINKEGPAIAKKLDDLKKQKTGLGKKINGVEMKLGQNAKLSTGIANQMQFLKKHGKVISDSMVKKHRATSKKAEKMQRSGSKKLFKSVSVLKREFDRNVHRGNDIHREMMQLSRGAARIANSYNQGLAIAQFTGKLALRILNVPGGMFRTVGKCTFKVLGKSQFLQRIGNSKFIQGAGKILGKGGKIIGGAGKFVGKGIGGVLKAPGVILMAPMKLQRMPQELAQKALMGTIRTTRKVVGKTVSGTARLAGKGVRFAGRTVGKGIKAGFKATVGKTKWFNKLSNRFKQLKGAASALLKKIASPFNAIKAWFAKIWASICSAISSLISAIAGALSEVIGYVALGFLIIILIMLIAAMFAAILDMIGDWWKDISASGKSYVMNRPEMIINLAARYRQAELDMYYKFHNPNGMIPSDNPLFTNGFTYEEMEKEALSNNGTGYMFSHVKLINRNNENAQTNFSTIIKDIEKDSKNRWNDSFVVYNCHDGVVDNNGTQDIAYSEFVDFWSNSSLSLWGSMTKQPYLLGVQGTTVQTSSGTLDYAFKARLLDYRTAKVQYSTFTSNQTYNFEISNAKDAMALFDTVFQDDPEHTSIVELLMYLGGNDSFQKGKSNSTTWKCDCHGKDNYSGKHDTFDSFFWASHSLTYNRGTKPEHVEFCTTSSTPVTGVSLNKQYSGEGRIQTYLVDEGCTNFKVIRASYNRTETQPAHRLDNIMDWLGSSPRMFINDIARYDNPSIATRTSTTQVNFSNTNLTAMEFAYNSGNYYSVTYELRGQRNQYSTRSYYPQLIHTNYVNSATVNGWHNTINSHRSGAADILHFYKKANNQHRYYVVDDWGTLLGWVDLTNSTYVPIGTAISTAQVQTSDGPYTLNFNKSSSGAYTLNYFELVWDSNKNQYSFDVYGKTYVTANSSSSSWNTSVNSSVFASGTTIRYTSYKPIDHTSSYDPTPVSVSCCNSSAHQQSTTVTYPVEYQFCAGHIDLDVIIKVATTKDEEEFWHLAKHVYGLPNGYDPDSYIFGIYQPDYEINGQTIDANGWGTEDLPAYNPLDDWKKTKFKEMCRAKVAGNIVYSIGNANAKDDSEKLKIPANGNKYPSMIEYNYELYFGFAPIDKAYYIGSYVSGPQEKIEAMTSNGVKYILTHSINENGVAKLIEEPK